MEFTEFQSKVTVLNKEESNTIRQKYIHKFVDTKKESYKKNVEILHPFSDGYCYLGYLWDCLKNPIVIDREYMNLATEEIDGVYVFWDIHSCERIWIENYWKFEKEAVLKVDLKTLVQGKKILHKKWKYLEANT